MCRTILLDISLTPEQAEAFSKLDFKHGTATGTLQLSEVGFHNLLIGLLALYVKPYEKEDVSEPAY